MSQEKFQCVALITGASRRIGAAIAEAAHAAGYRVILHCHQSVEAAQALAIKLNDKTAQSAHVISADLRTYSETTRLIEESLSWARRLDLLVNNAAVFFKNDSLSFDEQVWDELFTLNVKAPLWLSQAAYPFLNKTEGSIINITDIHADNPLKDYLFYCQSKAALVMQTKALAREFAPRVRVNGVAPGAIAWPEAKNTLSAKIKASIIQQTPLKKHGTPESVAQAVISLARNSFITGQVLNVDGGRSIR